MMFLAAVGKGEWSPRNDARQWLDFSITARRIQAVTLLRRTKETERLYQTSSSILSKCEAFPSE